MLASIVWDVDPIIFTLGPLSVRWYGLLWATGLLLALWIQEVLYKNEKCPKGWTDSLFLYLVAGVIIGARVGHCLFYEWHELVTPHKFLGITMNYGNEYISHPLRMLKVWEGGLSSHGGAFGLLIAGYFLNKKFKRGYIWIFDRAVMGICITATCIRLGNLMNSEIYGFPTDMPWGFIFVRNHETVPCHPTQIYEMLYCLVTFAVVWWMYWKKKAWHYDGLIFGVFLEGIFVTRFFLEYIKFDQEAFESHMLLNMGQILSIPFILLGILLIVHALKKGPVVTEYQPETK
ncbi:MAG: prolipoprotein diacylglyceryl transferase [Paludibacteraceae bacterium]|nr:prolipoprotein diacylglyceryl transferase [Paludibacteraceae bacterium]